MHKPMCVHKLLAHTLIHTHSARIPSNHMVNELKWQKSSGRETIARPARCHLAFARVLAPFAVYFGGRERVVGETDGTNGARSPFARNLIDSFN